MDIRTCKIEIEKEMDFSFHCGFGIGFFFCIILILSGLLLGELTGSFRMLFQIGGF